MSAFTRDGDFPARRLLDKLMFWEGHLIREMMDEENTAGKVNEILQGRLDDLQRVPLVKRRIDEPVA